MPLTDSPPQSRPPRREGRSRALLVGACAVIVVAATVVRTWVAAAGWFYWDDLLLHSLAAGYRWPTPSLLFTDHDGHLMPGGMVLAWLAAHAAPLDFRLPLAQIAVLQLLAGTALARMLWVLLRGRAVLLGPLVVALALPLALPATTWWASALNSLPLTAAMAWAVAATIRLAQTGRRRFAVSAVLATVAGLAFVEKAVLVPVVAAVVLLGWRWVSDDDTGRARQHDSPTRVWRITRGMWGAQAVVLAAWAVLFATTVGRAGGGLVPSDSDGPGPSLWALVDNAYRLAVLPTLAGGPWRWERWHPGPPMADPAALAVWAGGAVVALVVAWSLVTRQRTGAVWAVAAAYPMISVLLVMVGRSGPDTAAEIVLTLRYHADSVVVLAAALGLVLAAAPRPTAAARAAARYEPWAGAGLVVALVASSSYSTAAYRDIWAQQPSRDYLVPLLGTLGERDAPLLEAQVPPEVLLPVTAPHNRLGAVLRGVPGLPPIGTWTTDPVVIDAVGGVHPAGVVPGRTLGQGPEPGCGYRIAAGGSRLELDGPLLGRDWIVQLNYLADADGTAEVRLDEGEQVPVPVSAGLHTVYVRVEGSGTGVTITPGGGVTDLCIGSGPVGVLVPR